LSTVRVDGSKKKSTRQSDAEISVQAASSKLSRNRPKTYQGGRPSIRAKKAATSSSVVQESRKNKKRTRQSNANAPESSGATPSGAPKKKLRRLSQIDARSRKQKQVESK